MKKKKHDLSRQHLVDASPGFSEWFRIDGTDIASNGEIALRLYASRLRSKNWPLVKGHQAQALDRSGVEFRKARRSLDSSYGATYYNVEGGKRALVNDCYLKMVGDPRVLIASNLKSRSVHAESGVNFSGVMVDDPDTPSFWISPIQEVRDKPKETP